MLLIHRLPSAHLIPDDISLIHRSIHLSILPFMNASIDLLLYSEDAVAEQHAILANTQWAQVLSGERFCLGYSYHVVMNNPEVGVSQSLRRKTRGRAFEQCALNRKDETYM